MAKERIDRDDEDLVRLYLTDIGQYLLLTKDDEVRLAKTIEEGKIAETTLNNSEKQIDPTKRRELTKLLRPERALSASSCSRICDWLFQSPKSIKPRACRC